METDFLAAVLVTGCGQTAGPTVRLNAVWLYVSEFRREIEATGLLNAVLSSPVVDVACGRRWRGRMDFSGRGSGRGDRIRTDRGCDYR